MFNEIKDWFELLSYMASIFGIPLAIFIYWRDKKVERRLKEKEALLQSHSLYVDYLKMCMENPDLEIYDLTYKNSNYNEAAKKELIIFEILIAYMESAFHYYKDHSDEVKRKRWSGWVEYIRGYTNQENFMNTWNLTEGQWDEDFRVFINQLIKDTKKLQNLQNQKTQNK